MFHEKGHGMTTDWNIFVTSHGKGENDGVGDDIKNGTWRVVLQQKEVVSDL